MASLFRKMRGARKFDVPSVCDYLRGDDPSLVLNSVIVGKCVA